MATASLAAVSLLGLFGRVWWFLDLFAHFRVQLGAALLACAFGSWVLRQSRVALLATAAFLLNLVIVSPQLVYQPTAEARGGGSIRLLHVNVNGFNREYALALELFRETDPDVLVVVEANERWMTALAPLRARLPYVRFEARRRFGVAILSRYPMSTRALYFTPRNPTLVADIETPRGPLRVLGTHPRSPVTKRRAERRDHQLEAIAAYARAGSMPTVLMGDMNTTPWGHAFRELVADSGLRDTSRGVGYQWSWPSTFWPMAIPIDHALVSNDIRVLDRRIGPSIGSDHLPLVLDIALP